MLSKSQTKDNGFSPGQKGVAFPSGNESGACVADAQKQAKEAIAAVVSITFDRADYLRRHVDSLLAVHGSDPGNRYCRPCSNRKLRISKVTRI